jgi:quercetin dioxygenase-like cupin family protein
MTDYFKSIDALTAFSGEKPTKADVVRAPHLFVGLNCFEPGQSQASHVHAGTDKFYLVLSGKARMTVGATTRVVGRGILVWAPADVAHGVDEALERTVMLVAMAPPPGVSRLPGH